jgi:hypothetical protein
MNHKNSIFTTKVKGTRIHALLQGCVRQARLPIGSFSTLEVLRDIENSNMKFSQFSTVYKFGICKKVAH